MGMYGGITGSVLLSKDTLEDLKSVNDMDYIFDCCGEGLEFLDGLMEGFSREVPFDGKVNLVFATATKAWRLVEILNTLFKVADGYVIYYSDEYGEECPPECNYMQDLKCVIESLEKALEEIDE